MPEPTPGPWSVPHLAQPDVKCDCGYVLVEHLMGAVATVHSASERPKDDQWAAEYPPREEAEANARLIAAAPALRDALEALLDIVHDSEGVAGWHRNGDVANWGEFGEVDQAQQALALADGQEEA